MSTRGLPLATRVVEVIADLGETASPRYRYGSGCLVVGRTVLTAAHVVTGAVRVLVRSTDKVIFEGALDARFIGDADGPMPDLALVEVSGYPADVPPIGLAAIDRESGLGEPVERCHAIGYPSFKERPPLNTADGAAGQGVQVRDTVDAFGHIPVLSGLASGLLSLQVSSAPRPLPSQERTLAESPWSGMSGAPVVAEGCLLGVVSEHAPREGPSTITVTPLSSIQADQKHPGWGPGTGNPDEWWRKLGVAGGVGLRLLPTVRGRSEPIYRATLREIQRRTPQLLDRAPELTALTRFATSREGYRWLVGGAWAGKTALVAELAAAVLPAEVDVVAYFLSRPEADADSNQFLAAVVPQLAYLLDEDPPIPSVHAFRALWERASEHAAAGGRHLLLVVDGLDEDLWPPGSPSVAALLPARVDAHAHVVVTSRPHPELPADIPAGHPLETVNPVLLHPSERAADLARLARQEIEGLLRAEDGGLAVDVLSILAAAAGPLAADDLVVLTTDPPHSRSSAQFRAINRVLTDKAARSLQPVGQAHAVRYQFAHLELMKYVQATGALRGPDYRGRIHQWAAHWQKAGWRSTGAAGAEDVPRYLLDAYPGTLGSDPSRLAAVVSDIGWVLAAVQFAGVDSVLAHLSAASSANPNNEKLSAMIAIVQGQAHLLRSPHPVTAEYVLRQICMRAAELGEDQIAAETRTRLLALPDATLVPLRTTRRSSRALVSELGRTDRFADSLALLPDGRVLTASSELVIWDPRDGGAAPVKSRQPGLNAIKALPDGRVAACSQREENERKLLLWDYATDESLTLAADAVEQNIGTLEPLPDGRIVTCGHHGQLLVWDVPPAGSTLAKLGRVEGRSQEPGTIQETGITALADGRVVSRADTGLLLVWDPSRAGAVPVELGVHEGTGKAVAMLPGKGKVITGGSDGRILVWDPFREGSPPVELGRYTGQVAAITVLSNGKVVTAHGPRILLWDPEQPGQAPVEIGLQVVKTMAGLMDGRLVTYGSDGRVQIWNPAAAKGAPAEFGLRQSKAEDVAPLPDGRLVTVGKQVLVWDSSWAESSFTKMNYPDEERIGTVTVLDTRSSQSQSARRWPRQRIATGGKKILVWDPKRRDTLPVEIGQCDNSIQSLAALPDGRIASGDLSGRILTWNPDQQEMTPTVVGYDAGSAVLIVATLADGRIVSGGQYGYIRVWDPTTPLASADPADPAAEKASVESQEITAWRKLPAIDHAMMIILERVSDYLIVRTDGYIVPDTEDQRTPMESGRHQGSVRAFSLLADGRFVSGADDGWVLLWDPSARVLLAEIGHHERPVLALATLPDGRVISGGSDGVRMWSVSAQAEVARIGCSVTAMTLVTYPGTLELHLILAYEDHGISEWLIGPHQADLDLPEIRPATLAAWSAGAAGEAALAQWGWALGRDPEGARHWRPRARGMSIDSEQGWRFRGREAALRRIRSWLERPRPDRRVLVVTGSPGAGKSAVLGRVVTTADATMRDALLAALPPTKVGVLASPGSVSCAVHAKGKTALEVAREIARAASAVLPGELADLAPAVRNALTGRPISRFNIIIDALDEVVSPAQVRVVIDSVVLPLAETCSNAGVQVVVGTRRRDDGGDLLGHFGAALDLLDLDDARYFAGEDLAGYALACLQLSGDERAGNPYADDMLAVPLAARIAEVSDQNFLLAGLIARSHGLHDDYPADPARLGTEAAVRTALAAYLDHLPGVDGVPAAELLTALAFAKAEGLPVGLWQLAIQAFYQARVSAQDLAGFARSSAADFLVDATGVVIPDSPDAATALVYRLFHQALNEALMLQRADITPRAADERSLTQAFTTHGRAGQWRDAPDYLLRSLPAHAHAAGLVDDLLTDDAYLLHADLRQLVPVADDASSPEGRDRARLLRLTSQAIRAAPAERAAMFSVTEALEGLGTAYRDSRWQVPYRAQWAAARPRADRIAFTGHHGEIHAVCAVNVDGRTLLASGSSSDLTSRGSDDTVRVWDPRTGEQLAVLQGHGGKVMAVCAVNVDGRTLLASGGWDGMVRVWDPRTGKQLLAWQGHRGWAGAVCAVDVDGRSLLASGGNDGTVRVWDPRTGKQLALGSQDSVWAVCAVDVDGRTLLASGAYSGTVGLWDPRTGEQLAVLQGHQQLVHAVCAVDVDSRPLLASGSSDHTIRVWDPRTGEQLALLNHGDGVEAVCAVEVDSRSLLASGGWDGTVRLWDPRTGEQLAVLQGHQGSVHALCAVDMDSRLLLASGGWDNTVRLWDPRTTGQSGPLGQQEKVGAVCAVEVDGRTLLASGADDGTVRLWDPSTGEQLVQLGHQGGVGAVCAVEVNGRTLLASSGRGTVQVWDPRTGEQLALLQGHEDWIAGLCALYVDGRTMLATGSADDTIRLWDPRTGEQLALLQGHQHMVGALCAVDVGGRTMLASSGYDGTVGLWDPRTREQLALLQGHGDWVEAVCAVDVDGRTLIATGSGDRTVRLWDPRTREQLALLQGHQGMVRALCTVDVGGRTLIASGSDDRTVRLWDPRTETCNLTVPTHHQVVAVAAVVGSLAIGLREGLLVIELNPAT